MNLKKLAVTTGIILSPFFYFSNIQAQNLIAQKSPSPKLELFSEDTEGIPKPKGTPNITLDIKIQSKKFLGAAIKIGTVEIRKNSLYASLLFGHYQIMFEKINDSTYVEHLFNNSIRKDMERYELFTTIKRNNIFLLKDYKTVIGTEREEKELLKNKTYDSGSTPAIIALNYFLEDKLGKQVNLVVLGIEYNFNLYDKRKGKEITKYAKMSEVIHEPDDRFLLEEYINLYAEKENGKIHPTKFEGKFTVLNSGVWDGDYKAIGIVKK